MIIVTGGAGFIGSAFIWGLNELGYSDIMIVDRLGSDQKWKNLARRKFRNILHKDELFDWLESSQGRDASVEMVFHFGACSSTLERDVDYLIENNVNYSCRLFESCTQRQIPFFYASSAATYGDGAFGYGEDEETQHKLVPLNAYGFSKHVFDCWVLSQRAFPPQWAGFKFFNVFGPGEYHKSEMMSLVAKAVPQIQENSSLKLFRSHRDGVDDGLQKRDFVYIKDVVKILCHFFIGARESTGAIKSQIYNVGTGTGESFLDLGRHVFSALDKKAKIDWIDMPGSLRKQYQYFTEASIERLRVDASYSGDFTPLEEAIHDYVVNYLVDGIHL